ncbi:hypothetical protein PRZ48_011416 [Zasmidium cellare]|uniref:Uncharacterized protein n=1 Tax=Zasmidium cellare TaxID=395010 RepID=A0ABR0E6A1_ZASCE|nr:hypothetical protein PRZ48_011416 [Zasmidium cellare]
MTEASIITNNNFQSIIKHKTRPQSKPPPQPSIISNKPTNLNMPSISIYSLALALSAALASAGPVSPSFYVKNFNTFCSDTYPQSLCTTYFDVTYSSSPSFHCSLNGTETDYVFCNTPQPETSIASYVQSNPDAGGHNVRTLRLRYEVALPGSAPQDTFGKLVLGNPQPSDFAVVAEDGPEQ